MPPKVKITKEKIIDAATEIVRVAGIDALNARGLATALGVSTQPIFSCFSSMPELRKAVFVRANSIYEGYLKETIESGEYPPYKSMGIGYIRFAREERELFKLLFMILHPDSPIAFVLLYLLAVLACVLLLLTIFYLMNRYTPSLLKVVAGRK